VFIKSGILMMPSASYWVKRALQSCCLKIVSALRLKFKVTGLKAFIDLQVLLSVFMQDRNLG